MVFFINDVQLYLEEQSRNAEHYDSELDALKQELSSLSGLRGDILLRNMTQKKILRLIELMEANKLKKLDTIHLITPQVKEDAKFIKDQFKIVKAAGGIVSKADKLLLIYRMGKWDLPKGKLEKGEDPESGAIREVEEECSVKVRLGELACKSWHTYLRNGKRIMKKTYWYKMELLDDSSMAPQESEDIQEVRWMVDKEIRSALYNTYRSIRWIFKQYYKTIP